MTTGVEETVVIVVGTGPSGLSTAACLHKLSIPYIILEREDCIASLFNNKSYDRLHLHLAKDFCQLAHMPFPENYPTYVSRKEFVKYMENYASYFKINPKFNNFVQFAKFDEDRKKWKVEAKIKGGFQYYEGRFLVVATGENSDAFIPDVDGLSEFKGEVIHSTQYKSGRGYEDKTVLVVGAGNSGMEIAYDLSNHGAKTSIVVRSPVLPTLKSIKGKENEVVFDNGNCYQFDAILFATGFKRSTHLWLQGGECLLNKDGFPKQEYPNHWKGENGVYCAGLARRGPTTAVMDAQNIANHIFNLMSK